MTKKRIKKIIIVTILILFSIVMLFPFFWMLRSSVMTKREIFTTPMQWLPKEIRIENYSKAFDSVNFTRSLFNSLFLTIVNVVGSVFSASFIAFGFARLRFPGRKLWFALLLSTMMIPYTVLIIPQFLGWRAVGGYNTFWPLIAPCFFGNAFNVFLIRQFYAGIPRDYDEAALMDGANYFTIYWKIILPMSKPALCSVGVFAFMNTWNDFMGPLLYLEKDELKTVSLVLQNFMGEHVSEWNQMMALATVITIPMILVYFMAQRYFIEGITFSGLKG